MCPNPQCRTGQGHACDPPRLAVACPARGEEMYGSEQDEARKEDAHYMAHEDQVLVAVLAGEV